MNDKYFSDSSWDYNSESKKSTLTQMTGKWSAMEVYADMLEALCSELV